MQKVTSEKKPNSLGYRNLIAWQKADELAKTTYRITLTFPRHELYGLTSQLRRAALSVPLNIIEGFSRNNKNEFRQFLRIALGSLAEVEYFTRIRPVSKIPSPKRVWPDFNFKGTLWPNSLGTL